jgi:hypothetical protein
MRESRRSGMRFVTLLAVLVALSLWLALDAAAKFRVLLSISPSHPRVGQVVTVEVRTGPVGSGACRMRLLAVAPGIGRDRALDAVINGGYAVMGAQGLSFHRVQRTARLGFLARMRRSSATRWQTAITFPRSGRWQLIIPNWCAPGYASPLPADRTITVTSDPGSDSFPTGWAVGGGLGGVLLVGVILSAWRRPLPVRRRALKGL